MPDGQNWLQVRTMWLEVFLEAFMEAAQSEQTSRTIRIICTVLVSLLFLTGIISLFLLVFVIEGQSLLRRAAFLLVWLGILAYFLQFLKTVLGRRKGEKRPECSRAVRKQKPPQ